MKAIRVLVLGIALSCVPAGGSPALLSPAEIALKSTELACLFASHETNSRALAQACRIAPAIIPIAIPLIEALIGERDGIPNAGARWAFARDHDGGSPDASVDARP